tara:strand:- start:19 stop:678 length:660 start_codon:yes stop_codon:yes gene_type:complete
MENSVLSLIEQKSMNDLPVRKTLALEERNGQELENDESEREQAMVREDDARKRFSDFELPSQLMKGIAALGFEYCTPIQSESLPYALDGRDIVGKAQTGTGKTAAFLTSIITDLLNHSIDEERYIGEARSLILAPTRELAMQISSDALDLAKYTDLAVHTLVGGIDYSKQLRLLEKKHCDILVGTPGRLLDFANSREIHLDQLEILVIDEAGSQLDLIR